MVIVTVMSGGMGVGVGWGAEWYISGGGVVVKVHMQETTKLK